jgi:hypothetical protein
MCRENFCEENNQINNVDLVNNEIDVIYWNFFFNENIFILFLIYLVVWIWRKFNCYGYTQNQLCDFNLIHQGIS